MSGQTRDSDAAYLKHLEMIQAVVSRMSTHSFALRGWSVTLVAGLFALAAKDANPRLIIISYLPVLAFWFLDAYYLSLERRFRSLFQAVAERKAGIPDFSMDFNAAAGPEDGLLNTLFSTTLLIFHGALFFTVLIVMAVFWNQR